MKAKKHFLVWCGNAGLGKTHLGAALVEWSLKNFSSYRKHRECELQKKLRAAMTEDRGDYHDYLKYFIDDDLLMIDDVGRDGWTEWREEILIETIEQRYVSMKPTIFTSNLSQKDFEERYNERVASRLFAKENFIIEIMDGVDKRKQTIHIK